LSLINASLSVSLNISIGASSPLALALTAQQWSSNFPTEQQSVLSSLSGVGSALQATRVCSTC
jgi:hypothetical protein